MPPPTLPQPAVLRMESRTVNLRREFRLLAEVAFDDKASIAELMSNPALDWDYLLAAAKFHGLVPVLAPRLLRHPSSVPERIRSGLRELSRRTLEATLALSGELVRVLRNFNAAQILCLPFKGPALAADLWGNFTLRQSMDVDLLVRPSQVGQAIEILQRCGYEPQADWKKLLPHAVELPCKKTGMPMLELQWGIAPACFAVDIPIDECWHRASASQFGGQPTLALAPEDLMLLLCVHGWKHAWNRLLWIADVARLIRKSPQMDWQALSIRAKSSGTDGILRLGITLAYEVFGQQITHDVAALSLNSQRLTTLAEESIGYMQTLSQPTYAGWHRYLLLSRERRADRARHISRFLFTPGVGDWDVIRLPKFVTPLYRLVRLARVSQAAAQYAFRRA